MASYIEVSAVALGNFNPAIFQPEWFRNIDLIPSVEIDAVLTPGSNRVLVSNDITQVNFESLRLEVIQERWSLSTRRRDWIRDVGPIAASVFKILPHTPIHTLGVNYVVHQNLETASPAELVAKWAPLEKLAELAGTPVHFGGTVKANWEGFKVTLTLEPSVPLKGSIYVNQNYERAKIEGGAVGFCSILAAEWTKVLDRAEKIIGELSKVK